MPGHRFQGVRSIFFFVALIALAPICIAPLILKDAAAQNAAGSQHQAPQWNPQQTVEPAALLKELSHPGPERPIVACVGFRTLYAGAHVPGATFHGPAINAQSLADLKKWAEPLPRTANLVVYCGCCPLTHCPNLHPAFAALRSMGFTHLRVLLLPQDFAHDWVERGYPVAKGVQPR